MTGFWRPPYATDFQLARGGSSGGGTTTSTSTVQIPSWLDTAGQNVVSTAESVAGRTYQANPYTTVADQSPDTTAAYDTIRNMQGATQPAYSAAESAAGGLLGSATPLTTDQINQNTAGLFNPYTTAVVAPAVAQMRQGEAQSLAAEGAKATGQGAFGGSRQGVQEGTLQAQEALGEGQLTGGLLQSGWNTAQQQAMQMGQTNLAAGQWATSELPTLASTGAKETATEAGLLESAGRSEQAQQQAVLDQEAQNWQTQWDYPTTTLDELEQAVSSVPYGQTTTNVSTGTGAKSNVLGEITGAAGATGSLLSGIAAVGLL
jgi:hypothetical protein